MIAEAFDKRKCEKKQLEDLLGAVQGIRGLEIMVEYVDAFTRFVLLGEDEPLLRINASQRYPEVKQVRW